MYGMNCPLAGNSIRREAETHKEVRRQRQWYEAGWYRRMAGMQGRTGVLEGSHEYGNMRQNWLLASW